jgi:hypothetical protein
MISFEHDEDQPRLFQDVLELHLEDFKMARNFISDYFLPDISDEFCKFECINGM